MGAYSRKLLVSNSENKIIEAVFSFKRFTFAIVLFVIALICLIRLIIGMIDNNTYSINLDINNDNDTFAGLGIIFMYSFIWGCVKLMNALLHEVTLTNKRLIIVKGFMPEKKWNIPINLIHSMEIDGSTLIIHGINGEVVNINYIKNFIPLKEALIDVLDKRENEKPEVVQTQALLGLTRLAFPEKENNGCAEDVFWMLIVPIMGVLFGSLFSYVFGR